MVYAKSSRIALKYVRFKLIKRLRVRVDTGPAMARRGDRIRCTVLFQKKREVDGKIPVFFTLNGSEIIVQRGESPESSLIFMDFKEPLFPFIGMTQGSSVLAKMHASEEELQESVEDIVSREVRKSTNRLEEKLDTLLQKLDEKGK